MSKVTRIVCDKCCTELELDNADDKVMSYEGWGEVINHDEHYCPECWEEYTYIHDLDPETGEDLPKQWGR